MEKCSVRVVIARAELKSLLELLVQREIIVVQQLADAFGAAACIILDGLGEHLLLGVEVVVGEPRSHTSCTRYSADGHVVVTFFGKEFHGAREELAPAFLGIHHGFGNHRHLLGRNRTP